MLRGDGGSSALFNYTIAMPIRGAIKLRQYLLQFFNMGFIDLTIMRLWRNTFYKFTEEEKILFHGASCIGFSIILCFLNLDVHLEHILK